MIGDVRNFLYDLYPALARLQVDRHFPCAQPLGWNVLAAAPGALVDLAVTEDAQVAKGIQLDVYPFGAKRILDDVCQDVLGGDDDDILGDNRLIGGRVKLLLATLETDIAAQPLVEAPFDIVAALGR